MSFRHISHTADVTIEATDATLPKTFSEVACALTAVMCEDVIADTVEFPINISAESLSALLFDFVSELIVLLDTEELFVSRCELSIDETACSLQGTVFGDRATNYERHGDVKAPTYHALTVEKTSSGWLCRLTLDL